MIIRDLRDAFKDRVRRLVSRFVAFRSAKGDRGLIIGVRAVTLMGPKLALTGVILPATVILAITLAAAVRPNLQGILLTAEVLGFFIAAMMLIPKLRLAAAAATATA